MSSLAHAVSALKRGRAIVFPTDTVYGLGVAVRFASSPQLIYDLKGREGGKPVAWLVGSVEDLDSYGADVSEDALLLARKQWPGAFTLVVKASDAVPPAFRSVTGTIGLRMPANETALELIRHAGPLATSSANLAGQPASSVLMGIDDRLLCKAAAVVQDDEAGGGAASTVIDFSQGKKVVLRGRPSTAIAANQLN